MEQVNRLIRAGAPIPTAIKTALLNAGLASLQDFAVKHGRPPKAVSNEINGNVRATDGTIAALVAELGGTEAAWRELLWVAAKPDGVPYRPHGGATADEALAVAPALAA